MKAITPVIATVMLMLITVGMVGMTYTWFSNMMATQTEKNIAIPVGGIQCINNRISAIVTNAGANSNITDDDIVVADVNGANVRNTPFFGGFNTNGLVGYWRFEQSNGSAATNDSSGYGNMGTLTNMNLTGNASSGLTQGRFGNALLFDGVNDYVNAGNAVLDITEAITISAWIYPRTAGNGGYGRIVSKGQTDGWELYLREAGPANSLTFRDDTNAVSQSSNEGVISMNSWQHVAVTYDKQNVVFYVNGVNQGGGAETGSLGANTRNLLIGQSAEVANRHFNGAIDEVAKWNRALGADEITQLNKTNSGNFTLAPNRAITLINRYPVSAKGKYTVRVGTRNGVMERTVECL